MSFEVIAQKLMDQNDFEQLKIVVDDITVVAERVS